MTKLLEVDLRRSVPYPEAKFDHSEVPTGIPLNIGQSQVHRWKPANVMLEDSRETPPGLVDYIFTVPFKMASLRLMMLLRSFDCECEYLPLIVHRQGQRLEGQYFALNALRVVDDALDIEHSRIGYYDEECSKAEDVRALTLNEAAIGNAPLSFLSEIGRFALNERLAQAVIDADLVGIKLLEPEKFSN
jgi:hypothetical protein